MRNAAFAVFVATLLAFGCSAFGAEKGEPGAQTGARVEGGTASEAPIPMLEPEHGIEPRRASRPQPLSRSDCEQAGKTWNENSNICE